MLVFAVDDVLDGTIDVGKDSLDSFIGLGRDLSLELYLQWMSFDQCDPSLRNIPTLGDCPWRRPDNV